MTIYAHLERCWWCRAEWLCPDQGVRCPECGMYPDDEGVEGE